MAYNNAIPQTSDQPKDSQPLLLANFQAIKTLVDEDHVTFDAVGQGKHNKVSLPVQTVTPALVVGEGVIYNQLEAVATNKNQTYVRTHVHGGTLDVPFAASILNTAVPTNGGAGWAMLASGIWMRFESQPVVAGVQTLTLAATPGYPVYNAILQIMLTPYTANLAVQLTNIVSQTQFTVNSSGVGVVRILAIGY